MEQAEMTRKVRTRVNVSTTAKGIKTYDCTVESDELPQSQILLASDLLVFELEARYSIAVQLNRAEELVAELKKTEGGA